MMEEENVCLPQFLGRIRGPSFLDKQTSSTPLHQQASSARSRLRPGLRGLKLMGPSKTMISISTSAWARQMSIVRIESITQLLESAFKCFDSYLGFVQQTYYGLPLVSTFGKAKADSAVTQSSVVAMRKPV